jgi:hypothetical protein
VGSNGDDWEGVVVQVIRLVLGSGVPWPDRSWEMSSSSVASIGQPSPASSSEEGVSVPVWLGFASLCYAVGFASMCCAVIFTFIWLPQGPLWCLGLCLQLRQALVAATATGRRPYDCLKALSNESELAPEILLILFGCCVLDVREEVRVDREATHGVRARRWLHQRLPQFGRCDLWEAETVSVNSNLFYNKSYFSILSGLR